MASRLRKAALETRSARTKLPVSDVPVWVVVQPGLRLGYRRGKRGGTWQASIRTDEGQRLQEKVGTADDRLDADGEIVLDFWQAQDAIRAWFPAALRRLRGDDDPTAKPEGPYTVGAALDDYFTDHGPAMKGRRDAEQRADVHIRPSLGAVVIERLSAQRIKKWHGDLAAAPRRLRSRAGAALKTVALDPGNGDQVRARRDSANRVLTILKAALNHAWRAGKVADDSAWRKVRPFPETTKARVRFLSAADQQRLLNTCSDQSLRDLVAAGLLTGCRFSELARLRVDDWHRDGGTVFVAQSKGGKARHIPVADSGRKLFERLSAGKTPTAPLLARAGGEAWGKSTYFREFKAAVARAKVGPLTFHELRHSFASSLLAGGAPLMMVAEALGHADSRMAEKHYGHLAKEHVYERLRAAAPVLDVGTGGTVAWIA